MSPKHPQFDTVPALLDWRAGLLGLGLGGLFDGILFHQVLGWHHLLSEAPDPRLRTRRAQEIADGLFAAGMFGAAAIGGGALLRDQRRHITHGAGTRLAGDILIGFGLWHVIDNAVFHWTLGLHHMREDSAHRNAWDIGDLVAGLGVIGLGLALKASARQRETARTRD